jgi:signal transduction histidine kinase
MREHKKDSLLIIDDRPENIEILRNIFKDRYAVKAATSGAQGLKIIRSKTPPDLILLDIVMPDMDGFEVCRKIKRDERLVSIPIIFITAKNDIQDKILGFSEGGVDYITKPFEPEEVLARVHTHIELQRARKWIQSYTEELEAMLQIRTRELIHSERQAAFGQMVQGIVHNISNPLSGIMGNQQYIQLLIDQYNQGTHTTEEELNALKSLAAQTENACRMIGYSVEQLNQIIQSLLAKSRTDKTDRIKRIDMNELIRMEINFLEADMRFKHNLDKKIDLSEIPLVVDVIPAEVAQVFHNIVINALDAMNHTENRQMIIRSGKEESYVYVEVTDNGEGISKDIQNRIFDPFFTTKTRREDPESGPKLPVGTGLGLWMCRETLKTYGGSIRCESEPGQGTCFYFTLPKAIAKNSGRKK